MNSNKIVNDILVVINEGCTNCRLEFKEVPYLPEVGEEGVLYSVKGKLFLFSKFSGAYETPNSSNAEDYNRETIRESISNFVKSSDEIYDSSKSLDYNAALLMKKFVETLNYPLEFKTLFKIAKTIMISQFTNEEAFNKVANIDEVKKLYLEA